VDGGAIEAAMVEGPGAYHMGLVDILQKWDWNKKAERCFKTTVLRKNKDGLSAIEPFVYQRRCEKHASVEPLLYCKRSVYQDRLGTDIEKTPKSDPFTKTGSGQTYGALQKEMRFVHAGSWRTST
jgi:hypothetical protein